MLSPSGLPCTCPFNPFNIDIPPTMFKIPYLNSKWDWILTVRVQIIVHIVWSLIGELYQIISTLVVSFFEWTKYRYDSQIICLIKWYFWYQFREDSESTLRWSTVMKLLAAWILKLTSNKLDVTFCLDKCIKTYRNEHLKNNGFGELQVYK